MRRNRMGTWWSGVFSLAELTPAAASERRRGVLNPPRETLLQRRPHVNRSWTLLTPFHFKFDGIAVA